MAQEITNSAAKELYMSLIPKNDVLDENGYPTKEFLNFIKGYTPELIPTKVFLEILYSGWYFGDWGFILHRKYRGIQKLELHTGGWSGNEETINAIKGNIFLNTCCMKHTMWRTGGHYYFEVKINSQFYDY